MKAIHLLVALAVVTPLGAQQADSADRPRMPMSMHGMMGPMTGHMGAMMGPMGPMMGPAMRMMAFTPAHLLMHKDVLKLTDAQVAKLTALRDGAKAAHDAAMADMEAHRTALLSLMGGAGPDTSQLKSHFQAAHAAAGKAHWAMLAAAAQSRGLLTDVQRARADGWADAMERMGAGMGHNEPMGPGTMRSDGHSMHH